MKSRYTYIAILSMCISHALFGQFIPADSTKLPGHLIFCSDREGEIRKPVHPEWVQMDKDIITNILNKLPAAGATISGILQAEPHFFDAKCSCVSIPGELEYGLKSMKHTISGGYGFCSIDVVYFGNYVLKLKLLLVNYKEVLRDYLLDVITVPFECVDGRLVYEKKYTDNLQKYMQDSGRIFLESADTNYRRRKAINYFTDVLTGAVFDQPYYTRNGLGPETFNHLRYFIINKDYDALESILFSPNPAGRLFAARTLLYMKEKAGYAPDDATGRRIEEVIAHTQPIRSGVLGYQYRKFEYDYYDIVKDFEHLLNTQ